jgi:hypothetical protein
VDLTPWSAGGSGPVSPACTGENSNDVVPGNGDPNSVGNIRKRSVSAPRYAPKSPESHGGGEGVRCRRYQPRAGFPPAMIMRASSSAMVSVSS